MKYYDVGAIEKSLELPIGARFRFRDTSLKLLKQMRGECIRGVVQNVR